MANRSMKAKQLKMMKARAKLPKSYSSDYIPTGLPPNREVMSGYKERARGLAFDQQYMDWLENKFQRFHGKTPSRLVTEVRRALLLIEEAAPSKTCFTLKENSVLRVRCFFNSDKTLWKIMEEDFRKRELRVSQSYSCKNNIVLAWRENRIRWMYITQADISREVSPPPLPAD